MILLTREEISELTIEQCQTELTNLAKEYDLDLDHSLLDKSIQQQIDSITNMMLWLEDRIKSLDLTEKLIKANEIRWAKI